MFGLLNFMFEGEGSNVWSTVILIVMIVLVVALLAGSFFMQKKQRKQAEASVKSLKVGDEIVTIGGIKGKIVDINDEADTMDIETGAGVVITFFKGAIQPIPAKQPIAAPAVIDETPAIEETTAPTEETAAEENVDDEVKH